MIRIVATMLTGCAAAVAWADPPDSHDEHRRAGYPQEVHRHAVPSDTGRYVGYWVGGGAVSRRHGDGPAPHEGTWGWDYTGGWFQRRQRGDTPTLPRVPIVKWNSCACCASVSDASKWNRS